MKGLNDVYFWARHRVDKNWIIYVASVRDSCFSHRNDLLTIRSNFALNA